MIPNVRIEHLEVLCFVILHHFQQHIFNLGVILENQGQFEMMYWDVFEAHGSKRGFKMLGFGFETVYSSLIFDISIL